MRFPFDLAALAARAVFITPFARRRNPSITPQRRRPLVFIDLRFFFFSLFFFKAHVCSMKFHSIGLCTWRHVDVCKCSPAEGERKKADGKTHILASLQIIFFCRKFRQCHSVRTPRHLATVNPQRSVALLWVVWTGEFGLVSPPEWSWTGTKFLFGHSQRLVGETEGSSCLSDCFFSSYFPETLFPIYRERSWLRKTYLYSSSPPGLCEDPSTSCPLTL